MDIVIVIAGSVGVLLCCLKVVDTRSKHINMLLLDKSSRAIIARSKVYLIR